MIGSRLAQVMFLHAACVLCLSCPALGHGVDVVGVKGGVGVTALYSDGTPLVYGAAEVFAPGDAKDAFSAGVTDVNGRFMFYPDAEGVWTVVIDDEMGHKVKHELFFTGEGIATEVEPRTMERVSGVVTGLAVIFGIFGWGAFLRLRRLARAAGLADR